MVRKVFDMTRAFDCIQTLYLDEDKDFQNFICTDSQNEGIGIYRDS